MRRMKNGTNVHLPVDQCAQFTHAEVRKLIAAAVARAVAQFVEPVVFGGDEEVPGQQGADAQEEKDDVDKTVRVLRAVAHGQRHGGVFGQERRTGAVVIDFLVLGRLLMAQSGGEVRRVEGGLHHLALKRFLVTGDWTGRERRQKGGVRQETLNSKL